MDGDKLILAANRNCHNLPHVSWALAKISCSPWYSKSNYVIKLTIVLIISHFSKFCKIPWNSAAIWKFHGKGKIPRLSSKFRGPRKTV